MKKTSAVSGKTIPKKRNPVKRFFVNFFVLLLFSALVFYLGWVQFDLEEGEYGVFFSKTCGYEEEVLIPGEFNWRWEQLIPTNSTLHIFRLEPAMLPFQSQGELPSAELYAGFINEKNDVFSWNYSAELKYSLNPDFLSDLVKKGYAEDPESWKSKTEVEMIDFLSRQLHKKNYLDDLLNPVPDTSQIISALSHEFPFLINIGFTVKSMHYPDFNLYRDTASLYRETMRKLKEAETEILSQEMIETAEQNNKLDLLARYGEILGENPILLDFLTLETPEGTDPGIINSLLPGISTFRE